MCDIPAMVITGLALYLFGMFCYLKSILDFFKPGKLITGGLYRISRNQQALSFILIYFAIGLLGKSIVYLVFSFILMFSFYLMAKSEERHCLKIFGKSYKEHMNKTPRFL